MLPCDQLIARALERGFGRPVPQQDLRWLAQCYTVWHHSWDVSPEAVMQPWDICFVRQYTRDVVPRHLALIVDRETMFHTLRGKSACRSQWRLWRPKVRQIVRYRSA